MIFLYIFFSSIDSHSWWSWLENVEIIDGHPIEEAHNDDNSGILDYVTYIPNMEVIVIGRAKRYLKLAEAEETAAEQAMTEAYTIFKNCESNKSFSHESGSPLAVLLMLVERSFLELAFERFQNAHQNVIEAIAEVKDAEHRWTEKKNQARAKEQAPMY